MSQFQVQSFYERLVAQQREMVSLNQKLAEVNELLLKEQIGEIEGLRNEIENFKALPMTPCFCYARAALAWGVPPLLCRQRSFWCT